MIIPLTYPIQHRTGVKAMAMTISTHNGSQVAREHNIRNPKVTSKEPHIQQGGNFEIWKDEKPQDAYKRIFGQAVEDYNAKQKRADRRIADYYKHICNDKKKHPVYEMIITVGDRNDYKDGRLTEETAKSILREFVDGWQERNPHLVLIGAYYHADEQGAPHAHLDYIPVATGYKRGLETQSALVKALEQQGFTHNGKETEQIQWQRRENAHLESLCLNRGIEVTHPLIEGRKHLDTAVYQTQQELEKVHQSLKQAHEQALSRWQHEKSSAYDVFEEKIRWVFMDIDEIFRQNAVKYAMSKDTLQALIGKVEKLIKKGGQIADKAENYAYEVSNINQGLGKEIDQLQAEVKRLKGQVSTLEQSDKALRRTNRAIKELGLTDKIEQTAQRLEEQDKREEQQRQEQNKARTRKNRFSL